MVLLDMLFVDFSFLFSMQLTQVWKCVFISLTLIQVSGFNKKKKKKSRHNNAYCTPCLCINMCMIHASFENS